MRLPLLDLQGQVPTQVPMRTRLGASLASERDLAIDANLPRSLPQTAPYLPSDYGQAAPAAIIRLATTALDVTTGLGDLAREAAVRKQDADDLAEATDRYTQTALSLDATLEELKTSTDHNGLKPAYAAAWTTIAGKAVEEASNPRVQRALGLKLSGLKLAQMGEVNTAARQKYLAYHEATLQTTVRAATEMATAAPTEAEYRFQVQNLESIFTGYARSGIFPPDKLETLQAHALTKIREDRASAQAFVAPLTVMERIGQGAYADLGTKQVTSLMKAAEDRLRTLRADAEHLDTKARRETLAQQNDRAITWRQRISENYQPGGAGLDLLAGINGAARELGEGNHAQIQEMDRVYRERFLNPKTVGAKSNPETVGRYQHAILTGRFAEVTQDDLLRSFKGTDLDEADYKHLSGLLDTKRRQALEDAQKPKTEDEKYQAQRLKDAEKTIDEFLKRGSRFQGDEKSVASDILVRDAINELHMKHRADPTADPLALADDLIAHRMSAVETIAKGLPYKSADEVLAAYQKGQISKATATRYYKIFKALHENPPKARSGAAPDDGGIRKPVGR